MNQTIEQFLFYIFQKLKYLFFSGTYQIKKSDGVKHYVAQNIRNFSNSELVRKIQNHLRGLKFAEEKIPGRTYMEKIINSLPAKKAKQMKGLCDTVDEGKYKEGAYYLVTVSYDLG